MVGKILKLIGLLTVIGGSVYGISFLLQKITGEWGWEGWVIYLLSLVVIVLVLMVIFVIRECSKAAEITLDFFIKVILNKKL
jgi:sugar phosphate permease